MFFHPVTAAVLSGKNVGHCTLQFDTDLIGLYFDSRSHEREKAKASSQINSQSCQSI